MDNKIIAPLLVALMIATPAAFASGKIYKWTDAQGGIHYGANPPLNANAEEVSVHGGSPADHQAPPAAAPEKSAAAEKEADQPENGDEQGTLAKNAKAIQQNCKIAKQNLIVLQNQAVKRFRDSDGHVVRYTEEQRQKRIKDAQDYVDQFCSK